MHIFNRVMTVIRLFNQLSFHLIRPKVYDAVIFYPDRDFLIREYILDPIRFSSISLDPMKVNLHYLILYKLLLLIISNPKALINRSLFAVFTEAHILSYSPKAVITLIDDCGLFSKLSEYCKDTDFYAIQNGTRSIWQLKRENEKIFLTYYFCFGKHVVDLCNKYNHTIINPIIAGSFIADIYYYNYSKHRKKEIIDICLIDQWVQSDIDALYGNDINHHDLEYLNTLRVLDQHLKKYINDNNYSIAIADRGGASKKYYSELFGENVIRKKDGQFSTYETMFNSSLIIGTVSTTLSEAFGWGKKVLFFDLSEGGIYSSTVIDGIWSIKCDNYTNFKNRLDKILSMSEGQYKNEFLAYAEYRMSGVQDNEKEPSYKLMQNKIMNNS